MEYMLVSTEKYNFFQSRNPGIWALPIPGFGIQKNLRDPGITIPTREYFKTPWQRLRRKCIPCSSI